MSMASMPISSSWTDLGGSPRWPTAAVIELASWTSRSVTFASVQGLQGEDDLIRPKIDAQVLVSVGAAGRDGGRREFGRLDQRLDRHRHSQRAEQVPPAELAHRVRGFLPSQGSRHAEKVAGPNHQLRGERTPAMALASGRGDASPVGVAFQRAHDPGREYSKRPWVAEKSDHSHQVRG